MTIVAEALRRVLHEAGIPGSEEVFRSLLGLCPALVADADVHVERVNSRVFRLSSAVAGGASVILKRLTPGVAERNELLIGRWLPAIGLPNAAPALLGTIGDRLDTAVWQVYEDLGPTVLEARCPDPAAVSAAVELIAQLHTRAASSPVLTECRVHLEDRGIGYFVSNVAAAIEALESLRPLEHTFSRAQRLVQDRLLERLDTLRASTPSRAQLMGELGGPDTLLHGDLWNINAIVVPTPTGPEVRFIDWDRAAVGPVSYDVSTFLYRFPPGERPWILRRYREAVHQSGWRLPEAADLNVLFETAECARYANRVIWPAAALINEGAESGHEELAQILGWFETLEPVLQQPGDSVA